MGRVAELKVLHGYQITEQKICSKLKLTKQNFRFLICDLELGYTGYTKDSEVKNCEYLVLLLDHNLLYKQE
jgi:hypothetical protein